MDRFLSKFNRKMLIKIAFVIFYAFVISSGLKMALATDVNYPSPNSLPTQTISHATWANHTYDTDPDFVIQLNGIVDNTQQAVSYPMLEQPTIKNNKVTVRIYNGKAFISKTEYTHYARVKSTQKQGIHFVINFMAIMFAILTIVVLFFA